MSIINLHYWHDTGLKIHLLRSNGFTTGNGNVFQEATGQGENLVFPCQLSAWMEADFKLQTLAVTETRH